MSIWHDRPGKLILHKSKNDIKIYIAVSQVGNEIVMIIHSSSSTQKENILIILWGQIAQIVNWRAYMGIYL